jgi:Holliday junction resolvase RusA-like endonuclease
MFEPISFVVEGHAMTQGSKRPFVPTYKDGEPVRKHRADCPLGGGRARGCDCPIMVNTVDDADREGRLSAWRDAIAWTARSVYKGDVLDSLLVMSLVFYKPRPKNHYGTGRNAEVLKDSAPAAPGTKPDTGKLARAVEDALSGVIYADDALLVDTYHSKRYCHRWEPERVLVSIRPAEFQTVGDMVAADQLALPDAEEEFEQMALVV